MSRKPIDGVVQALIEVAVGKVQHLYRGTCPDAIEGFDSRDPQCPACRVLIAAQQQGQAVALPKLKQTDPSHSRAEMQWVFGYNAALADVMCLNRRTAPTSAPAGVDMERFHEPVVLWGKAYEYDRHGREAVVERRKPIVDELLAIIDATLAQQPAPSAPVEVDYAKRLATSLWQRHYREDAPQWEPFDDLLGLLSQIDNMVSGLIRAPALAQQPAAVDEAMELVRDIAGQRPEKPDYWSSCGQCESNINRAQEVLEAQQQGGRADAR